MRPKKHLALLFISTALLASACGGGDDGTNVTVVPGPGDATYKVTFVSTWSAATHPTSFPANPHFSGLIGATHNASASYWTPGDIASAGIESMAETGGKTLLTQEAQAGISQGHTDKVISAGGINPSPGNVQVIIPMSNAFSYITLVSMLAPSPDWFVGVHGLNLMENGDWVQSKTVDLYTYDAGSDDGVIYTSADADSNPKQAIAQIMVSPFEVGGSVPPVGQFIFERQ